jgi:porphobilinogen synthase
MSSLNMPTRLRVGKTIRALVRENVLTMDDIIYPLFAVQGEGVREEISSMKDQYHLSVDVLADEIAMLKTKGIRAVIVFGEPERKDDIGTGAVDENGIVQQAVREIKKSHPDMYVVTDVCLCQYKVDGHCCFFDAKGHIKQMKTIETLNKVAVSHAQAGADMVAPSDMMDGRVGSIRKALDESGFDYVSIMAYSAKYASNLYGPFRDAVHSTPAFGDRKSYQMDYGNSREAMHEMQLDIDEGADIIMVKPAGLYLDIIRMGSDRYDVPMAAYQVSGEYSMLCNAVQDDVLNKMAIYESLMAIKRSGADIVITYFAKQIKELLEEVE